MKILFISGLYPKELQAELRYLANGNLQNAPDVFQWAVVKGLFENNADFSVISFPYLPCSPMGFKKIHSPESNISIDGEVVGKAYSYNTMVGIKPISIRHRLYCKIDKWIRDKAVGEKIYLLVYAPTAYVLEAVCKIKEYHNNVFISVIITDLVDDMLNFASNRYLLKRLQCKIEYKQIKSMYKQIDKFVLLSKHMEEKISESVGRNIIIEGIYGGEIEPIVEEGKEKALLYTGTLEEFSGVRNLVDAFLNVKDTACQLWICGSGSCSDYIKTKAKMDERIKFFGSIPREKALELQHKARLLINPRQPNGGITKYSFPSKTMEYLASGTPMIGYKLEGIPEEYFQYMYAVEDLSVDALTRTIETCFLLSQSECSVKAKLAQEFIASRKMACAQLKRIIEYLNKDA